MRVFVPEPADGYELCQVAGTTLKALRDANARGSSDLVGGPVELRVVTHDQGKKLMVSDSPWLGDGMLVLRPRAASVLSTILTPHGEFCPVRNGHNELSLFRVTRVIDALEESQSQLQRFDSGRIMWVSRYAFNGPALARVDAFTIPQLQASPLFVSESLVAAWRDAKFQGLHFREVWHDN